MMTTITAYAECQRETIYNYYIVPSVTSAKYVPATDSVIINASYVNTKVTVIGMNAGCSEPKPTYINYYASIGGVNSGSTQVSVAAHRGAYTAVGNFVFTVNASSLNKTDLSNGKYTISLNQALAIQGGDTVTYPPASASSSIITDLATFVERKRELQNSYTCPAQRPQGYYVQERFYDLWSDGSKKNTTAWAVIEDHCQAIFKETLTESRSNSCPAGQTGTITQTRTYDVWTDGSIKNYSSWKVSGNTCAANPITLNPGNRVEMCPEGYTGKITYKWEIYYTNDSYSVTDPDGTVVNYIVSTPHQREVVASNTCKLIPSNDNITTTPGSITVTCDTYYGAPKGTYRGEVIKYGNYVTSYNSGTKQTTTTFVLTNNNDVSSCVVDSDRTMDFEKRSVACDAGQTGQKVEIRYFSIDNKGNKTYPYGTDYTVYTNTCASPQGDGPEDGPKKNVLSGMLSNNSVTTSSLNNSTKLKDFIESIDKSTINNGDYKLNLIIDDLNVKNYNIENVSNTIAAFQKSTSNTTVNVIIPKSINQYVGRNGITSAKDKVIVSSVLQQDGNLKVKYKDVVKGNKTSEIKSFNIKVFNSNVNMSNVKGQ